MIKAIRSLDPHHRVYSALGAIALVVLIWIGVEVALNARESRAFLAEARIELKDTAAAARTITDPKSGLTVTLTRSVLEELGRWRTTVDGQMGDAIQEFHDTQTHVIATSNRALDIVNQTAGPLADVKTGILAVTDNRLKSIQDVADRRLGETIATLDTALNGAIVPSFTRLSQNYADLPAALYLTPEAAALRKEITCREEDGSGYGVCWRGRITGILGEGIKAGAAIAENADPFAKAVTGIAVDTHKVTTKFTAPCVSPIRKGFSRVIATIGCIGKTVTGIGAQAYIAKQK